MTLTDSAVRYLTISELIYINGAVLNRPDILSGTQQIRDIQLLDAAVARPAASAFGQDAYPTLREKAAALLHSVARNHPFADGNKRTATVGVLFMFCVNGQRVIWEREEALIMILRVAEGTVGVEEMAAWFPLENALTPGPSPSGRGEDDKSNSTILENTVAMLAPDETADMALIAGIIEEQRWLLTQLEGQ
jgi:death-on-curing protein